MSPVTSNPSVFTRVMLAIKEFSDLPTVIRGNYAVVNSPAYRGNAWSHRLCPRIACMHARRLSIATPLLLERQWRPAWIWTALQAPLDARVF